MKFTLKELLEQKALLEKHLAWLEGKIADLRTEEPGSAGLSASQPDILPATQRVDENSPDRVAGNPAAEYVDVSGEFGTDPKTSLRETKQGCLIWIAAIVLISALVAVFFYILYPEWDDDKANERLSPKVEDRR